MENISKMRSNTTTLDAPPDRMSHNELLLRLDRQDALVAMVADQEHEKLRVRMVDKYGEEGVAMVEEKIRKEQTT